MGWIQLGARELDELEERRRPLHAAELSTGWDSRLGGERENYLYRENGFSITASLLKIILK